MTHARSGRGIQVTARPADSTALAPSGSSNTPTTVAAPTSIRHGGRGRWPTAARAWTISNVPPRTWLYGSMAATTAYRSHVRQVDRSTARTSR